MSAGTSPLDQWIYHFGYSYYRVCYTAQHRTEDKRLDDDSLGLVMEVQHCGIYK